MSDIKMYDILGQFNGLNTKSMPVSSSQTEPLYESIEPLDSVTESVTAMESKFAAFKENMVAEKTKRKSAEPKGNPENLDSADATIKQLVTKARFSRPGAKSDLEAIVYHIAKQDEELERAKAAEEEDREMIKKTQEVSDQMNDRFKKLNAKVASGQITAQDQAAAQAAQEIERDADAAKSAVKTNPKAAVQQIAEPTVKAQDKKAPAKKEPAKEKPAQQPSTQPASTVQNHPKADKKSSVDDNQPNTNKNSGLAATVKGQLYGPNTVAQLDKDKKNTSADKKSSSDIFQFDPKAVQTKPATPKAAEPAPQLKNRPAANDYDDLAKVVGLEENTEINEMDTGMSNDGQANAQRIGNFMRSWAEYKQKIANPTNDPIQPPTPGVKLEFSDGRVLNLSKATIIKLLMALRRPGTSNQDRQDFINNILADADTLQNYISNLGRPQQRTEPVNKGEELPLEEPDQEQNYQIEESLGNKTMTKPNSIIEAVRSVEDKKLRESAKPDFLDLDKDGDTDEPMKSAAKDAKKHEPADVDKDAVAKRKRLQALKDKQEDERTEKDDDYKSASRFVKGRAYGGSAQKDDEDDLDETQEIRFPKDDWSKNDSMVEPITSKQAMDQHSDYFDKKVKLDPKTGKPIDEGRMKDIYTDMEAIFNKKGYSSRKQLTPADYDELAKPHGISGKELAVALGHKKVSQVEEVAPPGAKAERMVKHIKKGYSKDGNLTKREKGIAYATAWKAHNKGQVEEATNFGDTIKNSKGKMTKVTVKEGKDAIRNHPIYTTKEAWDHYSQELAEQEAMDEAVMAPAVNVQQELDEIAKLAGLPTRACEACNCAPCKCDEGLEAMAPSDSSSPLTHAELDEAASRKDFRMVANLIKNNPDREKAKELAHHHADIFKQQNPRFKREMFLSACGLEECGAMPTAVIVGEDEMEEGNEFSGALAAAKASGAKDFEVGGKKYTVKEDININVTANGEEDVVNLIRKLSGMEAIKTVTDKISAMSGEACGACGSSPCGCEAVAETVEDGPKERDVEYTNSPREEQAGSDAAFPGGTDLNRPKKSYSDKPYRGDNPMAVAEAKEEALWKSYETMINDVKA